MSYERFIETHAATTSNGKSSSTLVAGRQKKCLTLVGLKKCHCFIVLQDSEQKEVARLQKLDARRAARSPMASVEEGSSAPTQSVDWLAEELAVVDPDDAAVGWVRITGFRPWQCVVVRARQVHPDRT